MDLVVAGNTIAEALSEELGSIERSDSLKLEEEGAFQSLRDRSLSPGGENREFRRWAEAQDARLDEIIAAPWSRPLWRAASCLDEEIQKVSGDFALALDRTDIAEMQAALSAQRSLGVLRKVAGELGGALVEFRHHRDISAGIAMLQKALDDVSILLPSQHPLCERLVEAISLYSK